MILDKYLRDSKFKNKRKKTIFLNPQAKIFTLMVRNSINNTISIFHFHPKTDDARLSEWIELWPYAGQAFGFFLDILAL